MVKEVKRMAKTAINGWFKWIVTALLAIALGATNWSVGREVGRNDAGHAVIVETANEREKRLRVVENGQTELRATLKAVNKTLVRIEAKLDR